MHLPLENIRHFPTGTAKTVMASHQNGMAGINAILLFSAAGLRFQGWDGIGYPHKSKRIKTTINTYAGDALDPKSPDRISG